MKPPTYEESIEIIRKRGKDVAASILNERGLTFTEAGSKEELLRIQDEEVERFWSEQDPEAAAAATMQCHRFLDQNDETVKKICEILCKWGDDHFYDESDTDGALQSFQLAAGLNPAFETAIKGVLSACLHGDPLRPKVALPYMVVLAKLSPGRDETGYVLKLIAESEMRISAPAKKEAQVALSEPVYAMAGGNMQRTGSVATQLVPPLEQVWTFQAGWFKGSPVIAGSILVIGDKKGMIHGLDWKTGQQKWERNIKGEVYGTPAILGNRVFVGDSKQALCLDLNTGEEIWNTMAGEKHGLEATFSMMGCILCFGDRVLFADSEIALFDADTGRLVHSERTATDPDTHIGGCSDGTYVYFPSGRSIMRLNPALGKVESVFGEEKIVAGPMIAEDVLVYGTGFSTIEAHALSNLKYLWSFKSEGGGGGVQCRPAYANGRLFFGSPTGDFYAVDKQTGTMIWKQKLADSIESSPLVCGNVVYIPARGFFALGAADGKILWKEDCSRAISCSPAIAGDLVFFGYNQLYAYRGKITGP